MTVIDQVRLSKTISHALRHAPEIYGLRPDPEGWVFLQALLKSLQVHRSEWQGLTLADIEVVITEGDKQRFERHDDMIRAKYGHSIEQHPQFPSRRPPSPLYHGTQESILDMIMQNGLLPMKRRFVHMSVDRQTALRVANRREGTPILLYIDTARAFEDGIEFFHGGETTWLANHIPPEYLSTKRTSGGEL